MKTVLGHRKRSREEACREIFRAELGSRRRSYAAKLRPITKLGVLMSELRESIEAELKALVVPMLRAALFKGTFPHFRRAAKQGIDLLTFQFDKNGGGFVIEISRCQKDGVTTYWGKQIPPNQVTAWDLHPDKRYRIQPMPGGGTDAWFRYDNGNFSECAKRVLQTLPVAEEWWSQCT